MLLIDAIDSYSPTLNTATAVGIFLMGTGLGALLTKVALAGQIRKLKDEITERLKAFNKAA